MKKILKTALSGIVIMGIFATSFIMPVSAEETSTSSDDTITVFEKDLSTDETTTNEIQVANNNSYGDKADAYIPEADINDQQTDNNSIST